ncbi:hypothetical protein BDQ94DRAFT_145510 [Aspergillus welwitschiae]|uniref:Uncharacterized protein n=1 Tax=Aspergillus welwitschiae TaxID=1341132 RepID=A0A3F3PZI2_9EURO|nr:hypothetical protein BDQ94DRAFT_145510 [Aspergillus welwitschiae]RDH32132.1 hypothetical protein BDQ94DRAFT_145510 [Aspergillus welwitschiae]
MELFFWVILQFIPVTPLRRVAFQQRGTHELTDHFNPARTSHLEAERQQQPSITILPASYSLLNSSPVNGSCVTNDMGTSEGES